MSNAKCQDIILARIGMTGINDQNDFFGSKIICIFFQKKKITFDFFFLFYSLLLYSFYLLHFTIQFNFILLIHLVFKIYYIIELI